ncbi:MAG: hypothetical protein ACYDG5_03345 [Dehalococcoidales bacterium]
MWLEDRFLIWWLHGPRYGWSKFRRWLFERGFLKTPLPSVNSLNDIQARLREVTWKQDSLPELFDSISYPQRVWKRKKDDCDGFAVLAAALLNDWDPQTKPVLVTAGFIPIANSHTVCVFKLGGGLKYFSNASLNPKIFQKYEEIVTDFTPPNKLICWDVVEPNTLKQLEFHKI